MISMGQCSTLGYKKKKKNREDNLISSNDDIHSSEEGYQKVADDEEVGLGIGVDTSSSSSLTMQQQQGQSTLENGSEGRRQLTQAEQVLQDIATEFSIKRAAGLVPKKPIPARTIIWAEASRSKLRPGSRGTCIFGRDYPPICGCMDYKSGVDTERCIHCNHGACWHRFVPGTCQNDSNCASEYRDNDMVSNDSLDDALRVLGSSYYPYHPSSINEKYTKRRVHRSLGQAFPAHASAPNQLQAALLAMKDLHEKGYSDEEIERLLRSGAMGQSARDGLDSHSSRPPPN